MKRTLTTFVTCVVLLFGSGGVGYAQDFQKGLTAAQSGDYVTALLEWSLLADQGDALAQYNLGVMYTNGLGVIQDNVYAHMWYNIAASSGDADAIKNRNIVAEVMTPSQIEKAQDLARECIRKKYKGC